MSPVGIGLGPAGTLLIADLRHHQVLALDRNGRLSVVAGTGVPGFSGDDGPAESSQLNSPNDVEADPSGNIYISDSGNLRVRRVDAGRRVITTVAGTGAPGFFGDGEPATDADVSPNGLAVDGRGRLFILESGHHRIRTVEPDGTIVTVAGTGEQGLLGDGGPADEAQFQYPQGLAIDGAGNLYIADTGNHRVRAVASDGTITTLARVSEATPRFSPFGSAPDGAGHLLVADAPQHRVWRIPVAR